MGGGFSTDAGAIVSAQIAADSEQRQTRAVQGIIAQLIAQQSEQNRTASRAQAASARSAERTAIALAGFDAAEADAARAFQANQDALRFNFASDQLAANTALQQEGLRVSSLLGTSRLENERLGILAQEGVAREQVAQRRQDTLLRRATERQALQNQNTVNLLQAATRRDTLGFIATGDASAFTVAVASEALLDAEDEVQRLTDRRHDAIINPIRELRREGRQVMVRIRTQGRDVFRPVDYIVDRRFINQVQQTGSDREMILAFDDPQAEVSLVPAGRPQTAEREGGFFRYYVKPEIATELAEQGIDLKRHCIYTRDQWLELKPHERNLGCIWTAMTNAGVNMMAAIGVRDMEMTSTKDVKKLAALTKTRVILSSTTSTRRYGNKDDPEARLTLIHQHYAHNELYPQQVSIRKMIETTDAAARRKANNRVREDKTSIRLQEVLSLLEKHGHLEEMPDEDAFLLPVSERRVDPMLARNYIPEQGEKNTPTRNHDPNEANDDKEFRSI